MLYDRITPASTRDVLFGECDALRRLRGELCALYQARGFFEVQTPSFEFFDVFSGAGAFAGGREAFKLTDAQSRMLCLRPDCTIPIARLVATKLQSAAPPIRLFYDQSVYGAPKEHSGRSAEFTQVGVELIGAGGEAGDLEILALAAESLARLGGERPEGARLEICHIGFYHALMAALDAPEDVKEQVRGLIEHKSYVTLGEVLRPYGGQPAAQALEALPRLFGARGVLQSARALTGDGAAHSALDMLESLCESLERAGKVEVSVDLGLVGGADYYTGVLFRGYVEGTGEPILSGGRYDGLLARFGRSLPATGFGVNASLAAADARGGAAGARDGGVTLALTKGRLEERTVEMLEQLGYDCAALHAKGRRLVLPLGDSGIRVILAKAADVITYVENGVADIGVVGKDTILESGGSFYEVLDLGFGRCRFAVAARSREDLYGGCRARRIATKYPRVALSYFQRQGMDVDIVKIEGSVELAPIVGLADAIVDLVETGSTLKENGLSVVADVCPVSARMIVNTASMKLKQEKIGELIGKVEGYLADSARGI